LDAIATTFRLGDDARQHLYRIAGYAPRTAPLERVDRVDADLLQLINRWPDNPVLVIDHTYDVVAYNQLGAALWRPFTYSSNLLLNVFLDDAALEFYKDWRKAAVNTTAGFRIASGARPDDPRIEEILSDLRRSSPQFIEIWERNEARGKTADVKTFNHPDGGELTLQVQTFDVRSAPGHQLVVYHADPGTSSADRLALLGTLAATIDAAELNLPDADHLEAIPTGATRDQRDRQR
jgi:MmyB-like transcription regulator ligand binding domain